ncbi:MAG: pyridoxal phosphate-dependent aminotransferase [Acidobacteriia bacterium]|nr:pyridoxal phosphate-dependent aminotransferase [Terriglobia bacterium]
MRFSNRTQWNLTPNELTRRVALLRERGRTLLDLTESNPTRCDFQYPQAIIDAISQPQSLSYNPTPQGLRSAREAVAEHYARHDASIDPDHLILTASTSEAYSFLFRLLAEPGDQILVPQPSYPLFDFLAQLNDVELQPYPLEYDSVWLIDWRSLEQACTPKTRGIILVNPNNPTGSGLSPRERDRLIPFCRDRELPIICDEVFVDFGFGRSSKDASSKSPDGSRELHSLVGETGTLTFVLNGISKMMGLPQMKLAWVATSGPQEWLTAALERLEVIADTYLSVSTPVQVALPKLLSDVQPMIQSQILDRIRANLGILDECVSKTGGLCRRLAADGGWSAIISIPRSYSEEEWVLRWLEQDHVLVHPGYFFDFHKTGYAVLSLLPHPDVFREAVQRLVARVQSEMKG